jgi:hypothetical protein
MASTKRDPSQKLEMLFRRSRVVTIKQLRQSLDVSSRMTVLRELRKLGYFSSYSHAGKYYTLKRIPTFDALGLWCHGEARFSEHGTLRKTIVVLVNRSDAGHTHEELRTLLGLRVYDTLRSLVEAEEIRRARIDLLSVHLAADPDVAALQQSRRESLHKQQGGVTSTSPSPLELTAVIECLVAVIHAPKEDARTIAARLRAAGRMASAEQVVAVFEQYGIAEKKRPRSRRSRR